MLTQTWIGEESGEGLGAPRNRAPSSRRVGGARRPNRRMRVRHKVERFAVISCAVVLSLQAIPEPANATLAGDVISAEVIWEAVQQDWPTGFNVLMPAGTTATVDLAPSTPEYSVPFFSLGGSRFEIDFFDGPLIDGSTNALTVHVDFADLGVWPIPASFQVTLSDLDWTDQAGRIESVVKVSGEPGVLEVIGFTDDSITLSMDSRLVIGGTGFDVEYRYTASHDTTTTLGPFTTSNVFLTAPCWPSCSPGDFPIDWGTIGTFNYMLPPGDEIVDVVVSGTWGDGAPFDSSAPVELYLDGVLVAECVQLAACWLDDGVLVDWSFSFADNAVPNFAPLFTDGEAILTAIQNDQISVILSNLSLIIVTRPAPTTPQNIVRFVDVAGDASAPINVDALALYLGFDPTTGDYELLWVAHPDNPFQGTFRLNANLFNPDTGTTAQDPAYFQDVFNDFTLSTPQQSILLTGNNPRLTAWAVGDRVAPGCPIPLGCPIGASASGTAVQQQSGSGVGADRFDDQSPQIIVPEPYGLLALGSGMLGLAALGRRKRACRDAPKPDDERRHRWNDPSEWTWMQRAARWR